MRALPVTAIERTKRGRYSVYLEGEFYCALHADIFAASGLRPGGEVAPERMAELHRASEQRITRDRALRLLGQRAYTEQGLFRKLCERTDEENAAEAVARMAELGLVDDRDYARRCAADCVGLKGFSHRRAAQELARRGVAREIIEETLDGMEEEAKPAIARVVRRKYIHQIHDDKGYAKTVNALARLGYRYGDIHAVIANLLEDEDYYGE